MKRVFIVGAGFSKAVADLPLTSEMINRFKEVLEDSRRHGDENGILWGQSIFRFWTDLEKQFLELPLRKTGNNSRILNSNYWTNFESVLTFIDHNLNNEVQGRFKNSEEEYSSNGPGYMFWDNNSHCLEEVRWSITTYLYRALINGKPNESVLTLFTESLLNDGDTVISFNYDLILERFLFQKRRWLPHDGYGLEDFNHSIPPVNPEFQKPSQIKLLKLHGSLNWDDQYRLRWSDDSRISFFPNYLLEETKYLFPYQGKHGSEGWILPSWIKRYKPAQLLHIWRQAVKALGTAEEIIVIGYSLPEEDSAVVSLLGTVDYKNCKRILLIDPHAKQIADKYRRITQFEGIEYIDKKLEDYLWHS
jgi:hypothetical protein